MAKRKTKKKAWKDFEVIKVRLNPEQAVLSCCDNNPEGRGPAGTTYQCSPGCGGGGMEFISS